ncbi:MULTISPECIES: hypothetical protein [Flavobacterium]|uniref:Uncharacterized protein n=1 Tax=Flavobacterium beibuense TaxID=657326 RepID=A0A444WFD3_9FLAO|nr:hypothetical protein [Flavobacterium beibuense]RYJ44560.1 hypothetical protein NU09_1170 [Flavobacterium beibuense]
MADLLSEFVTVFFQEVLFTYPGAFVRWIWFKRKSKFMEVVNQDTIYNFLISFFIVIGIVLLIVFV